MKTKATAKQKAFVGEFIKSKNATQAIKKVYGTTSKVANAMGSEYLAKPSVQTEIRRQLEISGLTDDYLDTSTQTLIDSGLKNSKWTKPAVALQAIAMVNKLKDRYPATRVLTASLDITAELEGKDTSDLIKVLKDIQLQNKKLLDRVENPELIP